MRNVVSRAYFISAFQANETLEANRMRHAELMRVLASEGHNPTEVQGRYNGVDKLSVAVRGDQTLEQKHCTEPGSCCSSYRLLHPS